MKKLLTVLTIALLSTAANAETAAIEFGAILDPIDNQASTLAEVVASKEQVLDSNLWEVLDTDKDGFISKAEAILSKQIAENWDSLDVNKDDKLDSAEFSQVYSQKN